MRTLFSALLHDPGGLYAAPIRSVYSDLQTIAGSLNIAVSSSTSPQVMDLLQDLKVSFSSGDSWGTGRLNSLRAQSLIGFDSLICMDFDKLLHWLRVDQAEFFTFVDSPKKTDLIVMGRTPAAWQTYPRSWQETEIPVNRSYSDRLQMDLDIMAGQLCLSRQAVRVILEDARSAGWESCGEFPLLVAAHNLSLSGQLFSGLSWEDPDRLSLSPGELSSRYDSPQEWDKRRANAQAILQLLDA